MSLLLSRRLRTEAAQRQRQIRFFSSMSPPYHIRGRCKSTGDMMLGDLCHSEFVEAEKKLPYELFESTATIGASHGWVATLKNRVLCLQDDLNPYASGTNPKRISLPRLVTLPHCQTQLVTNVAMSSSSPEDEDCIVAVKFLGPQLSLFHGSSWTNIRITDPSFFASQVMFSKRDQMFSLLGYGGYHIGSWDLDMHKRKPNLQRLYYQNLPKFTKTNKELFHSVYRTEHLVESTAGEMFLVKWYKDITTQDRDNTRVVKTKGVMVFKVDMDGNAVFTRDIGDLCIFISKSEPFCLTATSYPGLFPSSVYFVDEDEVGMIDLSIFTDTESVSPDPHSTPYFIPPQKLD